MSHSKNYLQTDHLNVTVLIEGVPLTIHQRFGDGKYFIEARAGANFFIDITNLKSLRMEVLSSVDGHNTQIDEQADLSKSRGKIITPNGTWRIAGWYNEAERFPFTFETANDKTIAALAKGDTIKTGVIGFAVFEDKFYSDKKRAEKPPFARASLKPAEIIEIHYGSREWLRTQGVIFDKLPSAFIVPPREDSDFGSLYDLLTGKR